MFKFIGRALAGLVLTKDAQKAVGQIQKGGTRTASRAPFDGRDAAIAEMQKDAQNLITPDRAELIRQAMKVRAAKQTILADLDDESRGKLVAAAMKALLNEGKSKE